MLTDTEFAAAHPLVYAGLVLIALPFVALPALVLCWHAAIFGAAFKHVAGQVWRGLTVKRT